VTLDDLLNQLKRIYADLEMAFDAKVLHYGEDLSTSKVEEYKQLIFKAEEERVSHHFLMRCNKILNPHLFRNFAFPLSKLSSRALTNCLMNSALSRLRLLKSKLPLTQKAALAHRLRSCNNSKKKKRNSLPRRESAMHSLKTSRTKSASCGSA
jgi:hypothetical protein